MNLAVARTRMWDTETFFAVALPALTTAMGLQLVRVLLPSLLWYLGDSVELAYTAVGGLAIGIFAASFLAGVFRKTLGQHRALLVAAGGVGAMRVLEQISTAPFLDLVFAALGTILFTFFFPVYLAHTRAQGGETTRRFGRGLLLGIALDTLIHGAFGTLDLSWQSNWLALVIVLALVAGQGMLLRRLTPQAGEIFSSVPFDLPLVAIGPFLFLSLVILQNLARLTTLSNFSPPVAFGFLVAVNAIGLAATLLPIIPDRSTMFAVFVASVFIAALASRPDPQEGTSDVLYLFGNLLAFPLVSLIFAGLSAKSNLGEFLPSVISNGIGWVLFALFTLLYYISYDIRLPFPNTWLPPVAMVIVGLAAILAMRVMAHHPAAEYWTSVVVAAIFIVVPLGMALNWRAPATIQGKGLPVRVMTYNVHNGFNAQGRLDLEAIAQTIEQANPDIIGLQEISRGWVVDSSVDIIAWLSQRLNMPYVFGPTADRVWGNAILSRYPIRMTNDLELPPSDLLLKRGLMWARIDVGNGDELLFIVTHFHHISKDTEIRQRQSPVIAQFWDKRTRTIFVGDLNARPDSKEIEMLRQAGLKDAFAEVGKGDGFTFDSEKPHERIDYIWLSPDLKASEVIVPTSTASDHLGVSVVVGK